MPRRTRPVVLVVVVLLAAMVGTSVLVDQAGDGDGAGEDAPSQDAEPSAGDEGGGEPPRSERDLTPPDQDEPGVPSALDGSRRVEPMEGWEEHWLIASRTLFGAVVQVPLGGGEVIELVPRAPPGDSVAVGSPMDAHLVGDVVVGARGGVSLVDGARWQVDTPPGQWEHVVGVTGTGTVVTAGSQVRERSIDGEVLATWNSTNPVVQQGQYQAVVGRSVLLSTSHGVVAFDLDDAVHRRLAHGRLLAVGGDLAAVSVCDDELRCEVQLLEVPSGEVVSAFAHPEVGPPPFAPGPMYDHTPTLSPDGTRLVVLDHDRRLVMIDTASGDEVAVIGLGSYGEGTGWRHATVATVWDPSVERMLVVVIRVDGSGVAVWSVDRDGGTVRAPEGLEAALDSSSARGYPMELALSDRAFEPVDQEP